MKNSIKYKALFNSGVEKAVQETRAYASQVEAMAPIGKNGKPDSNNVYIRIAQVLRINAARLAKTKMKVTSADIHGDRKVRIDRHAKKFRPLPNTPAVEVVQRE